MLLYSGTVSRFLLLLFVLLGPTSLLLLESLITFKVLAVFADLLLYGSYCCCYCWVCKWLIWLVCFK